jgi:CheY-like chemotaxis protein
VKSSVAPSGLTVTKKIRTQPRFFHTPIIALTAYVRKADEEAALAAGATSHIPKPVNIQYLLSEIQKHLAMSAE